MTNSCPRPRFRFRTLVALALAAASAGACLDLDVDDEVVDGDQAAINGGYQAREWMWRRAVEPQFPCSATLIAPRRVATALHCTQYNKEGTTVKFYSSATTLTGSRTVVAVHRPLGTSASPLDRSDWAGRFADIAILDLDADAPAGTQVSPLQWYYPGAGAPAVVVGNGQHDGLNNPNSELRFVTDDLFSADDASGSITTVHGNGNPGDSGGALYHDRRLLGVVSTTSGFTSVAEHLLWYLDIMDWSWPYGAISVGYAHAGTTLQWFTTDHELRCQYACASESACSAYNVYGVNCVLMTGPVTKVANPGWRSDAK